jgi:hypothetical protein
LLLLLLFMLLLEPPSQERFNVLLPHLNTALKQQHPAAQHPIFCRESAVDGGNGGETALKLRHLSSVLFCGYLSCRPSCSI